MRTLPTIFFTFFYLFSFAQDDFTIKGKIELLSQSTQIILSTPFGEFKEKINPDGSFVIKGNASTPSVGMVKTDLSGSNAIWIQPGEYAVLFREIKIDSSNKGFYFRIPELKGPEDAEIYHGFMEPRFYIRGNSWREILQSFHLNYIESIFKNEPSTAVLPQLLNSSRGIIGDEELKLYISKLNEDQKKDENIDLLYVYYKRKDKN